MSTNLPNHNPSFADHNFNGLNCDRCANNIFFRCFCGGLVHTNIADVWSDGCIVHEYWCATCGNISVEGIRNLEQLSGARPHQCELHLNTLVW